MEVDGATSSRWHPSIRVRVTAVAAIVVAAVLLGGAISLAGFLRAGLLRSAAGSALQRASEVSALAARAPLPAVLPSVDAPRRTLIQVVDQTGQVVAATRPLTGTPPLVERTPGARIVRHQPALGPGLWMAQPTLATVGGRVVTVVVYTSISDVERTMRLFVGLMAVAVPASAGFVALVVWLVAGRALRPVEAMRQEVSIISAANLNRRVPASPAGDEITRLAGTLNDMLGRLEAANERQRRFMADASHELRTPLANIRTGLEVAVAHPDRADWESVAVDAVSQTERMQRLTEDLLILASGDAASAPPVREPVDLAAVITAELDRPVPQPVALGPDGPLAQTMILADRQQIARALTNLVDNALRHATGEVSVGLRAGSRWAEVWVCDDGPGVPAAERERIFGRFVRLDEHRSRTGGGVGLGLAITRDIVTVHGGTVAVDPLGDGATFRIRLPLLPRSAVS